MVCKTVIRILCVTCVFVYSFRDDYLNQLVLRFVYRNEKICGDPFSNPYWVPALERCKLSCDPAMSICKENSNDMNDQTCESLPRQCIIMLRKSLGWRNYDEFYLDKTEKLQRLEEPHRVSVHSNEMKKSAEYPKREKVFRDVENKNLNDIINTKPSMHIVHMPSIRPNNQEKTIFSNKHENFVDITATPTTTIPTTTTTTTTTTTPTPTTTSMPKSSFLPALRKFSMKNTADTIALVDKSKNCCEWALNGLCDQNWKKVREMCPVSCGELNCEVIEGIMTCSRTININVEDCLGSSDSDSNAQQPIVEDSISANQVDEDNEYDLSERTYGKFIFF